MLASTREPYPLGIEAVAAVNLFKVDLWQAARMAARVQSSRFEFQYASFRHRYLHTIADKSLVGGF
jgi:hypothetical protein